LHLDSKLTSNFSADKAKIRRNEFLLNFSRLLSDAEKNGVKIVIIAGDLFDEQKITKYAKEEVISTINNHKDVEIIYLVGNHEKTAFLDGIDSIPSNLTAVTSLTWEKFVRDDVVISLANLTKNNAGIIYSTLNLNKEDKNIVVMHGATVNYRMKEDKEFVNIPELKDKYIDYLALGHYHSFIKENLDSRGIYAYSGCLEGRGFDELGDKGYVLIDTDDIKNIKFIPFAKRTAHEVVVEVDGLKSWSEIKTKVYTALKGISNDDIIKVVLTGKIDKSTLIFAEELQNSLGITYFFAKVYDETVLFLTEEELNTGVGIKNEFLALVNKDGALTEQDKTKIIQYGLKALKGEDF
ncbi:MAG: metallophosphoesterase, partial [Clostridia bacterium]|nr:metallophosphoesterase [Clostridia bacterium]